MTFEIEVTSYSRHYQSSYIGWVLSAETNGISGVFNNPESSAERQYKITAYVGIDSLSVGSHKVQYSRGYMDM